MAVPNLDAIATTTLKNYQKKLADNVSLHIPFMKYMTMKGAVITTGGDNIVEELMYGENGTVNSYSEMDAIDTAKQEGISAAEFNWKQVAGTVTLSGTDILRNSGESKLESLMEARIKQTEITMRNRIATMLFGDGTGNSGKDVLGLAALIDTDPTTGTLGNINRATYSFWRNQYNTSVGSFASGGLSAMGNMVRLCTRGTDRPNLIVTGSTIFGYLESVANGRAQFLNPALAEQGFEALKFQGIDVIYDSQCTADRMYFINTDYLRLRIHKDVNFTTGKFIEPANQDGLIAKVKFAGQVTVSNCALQGVLSGFSA